MGLSNEREERHVVSTFVHSCRDTKTKRKPMVMKSSKRKYGRPRKEREKCGVQQLHREFITRSERNERKKMTKKGKNGGLEPRHRNKKQTQMFITHDNGRKKEERKTKKRCLRQNRDWRTRGAHRRAAGHPSCHTAGRATATSYATRRDCRPAPGD